MKELFSRESSCAVVSIVMSAAMVIQRKQVGPARLSMASLVLPQHHLLLVWALLLMFQVLNVLFLLCLAAVYLTPWSPTSFVGFLVVNVLFTKQQRFIADHHNVIGAAYLVTSLPFFYGIVQMLWHSLKHRQLSFAAKTDRSPMTRSFESRSHLLSSHWLRSLKSAFVVGNGRYTLVMTIGEFAQVVIMSVQAHRYSKYLSNRFLNQAYGVMIFLKCWSTPVIYCYGERRRRKVVATQLTSLVISAILDFVWGVVLQGILFARYWHASENPDDRPWATDPEGTAREVGQLLVTSISNFVFSVFPFVASAVALIKVRSVLETIDVAGRVAPESAQWDNAVRSTNEALVPHLRPDVNERYVSILMIVIMLHGLVIVFVSITATTAFWVKDSSTIACQNQLHPWFTTTVTCVGRSINCTQLSIRGNSNELTGVLNGVNTYLLARLEFADCPDLQVPSVIQNFSDISSLRIINSTITAWNESASLRDPYLPQLQTLMIWNSVVDCIPYGILTHTLPSTFEWMDLEHIDADSWMPLVTDAWCSVVFFTCTDCHLSAFPHAIRCMQHLQQLQLQNNLLTEIPSDAVGHMDEMQYFAVTNNPLAALPRSVWELASHIFALEVQNTNVSSVPIDFVAIASPDFTIHAVGTPLCLQASSEYTWLVCDDDTAVWA